MVSIAPKSRRRRIGLLGGTFDPVHDGHLALARAAFDALSLDELRFVPTGRSWQKANAGAGARDRVEMVRLAIEGVPGFRVDEREARRRGNTYTIDTLVALRAELGQAPALVLLLGSDQLRNLPTWHRHDELLRHAHIAVTRRGNDDLVGLDAPVEALLRAHRRETLPDTAAGTIVFFPMAPVSVSASELRRQLARGDRPLRGLPIPVLDYIDRNGLYRSAPRTDSARADPKASTRSRMDLRKLQRTVVDALEDVKAQDIRVFDTTRQTELFDRVIVATGTSNRQTRALASHVRDKVKAAGAPVVSMEGADTGEWVLVDLGDIVVHVMQPAIRAYYNLEELWGSKPVRVRIGAKPPSAEKAAATRGSRTRRSA